VNEKIADGQQLNRVLLGQVKALTKRNLALLGVGKKGNAAAVAAPFVQQQLQQPDLSRLNGTSTWPTYCRFFKPCRCWDKASEKSDLIEGWIDLT
jgi:hypothetical protein